MDYNEDKVDFYVPSWKVFTDKLYLYISIKYKGIFCEYFSINSNNGIYILLQLAFINLMYLGVTFISRYMYLLYDLTSL